MRLKLTTGLSGPHFNLVPGDEHEFETAEALRLIEAGFAVEAAERAVKTPVMERRGKKVKSDVVSSGSDDSADDGPADD